MCASATLSTAASWYYFYLMVGLSGFLKVRAAFNVVCILGGSTIWPWFLSQSNQAHRNQKKRTHNASQKFCQMIRTILSVLKKVFESKKLAKNSQNKTATALSLTIMYKMWVITRLGPRYPVAFQKASASPNSKIKSRSSAFMVRWSALLLQCTCQLIHNAHS